jgi:D-3-phosphoglycerate dehydrogenase
MEYSRRPLVVITDTDFADLSIEREVLAEVGAEVIVGRCRTEADIVELAADADGLITQYAPITRAVIERLPRCRVVARYGIGVDTIDVPAATAAGIWVGYGGDYCRTEVAEHAVALLFALARRVVAFDRSVRSGVWNASGVGGPMRPIAGRTLGLVGLGTIGREVARRALALGLTVVASDPALTPEAARECGVELVDFPTLLERSDFVSLHSPLLPQTRHLMNAETLRLMKPTAYLINTSRGGLVDQAALAAAIREEAIAGAALDVLEREPISPDDPLLGLSGVIVTPHAAFYSADSLRELQRRVALNVVVALRGGRPPWVVNTVAPRKS